MNKKYSIEDLRLVYDRDSKKFTKAYVTIDGVQQILTDNEIIRNVMKEAADERGVDDIKVCPNDYSLAFASNEKAIASFERKYKEAIEEYDKFDENLAPLPIVLNENNPYDGNEVEDMDLEELEEDNSKIKKYAIGGVIGTVALASILAGGCSLFNSKADKKEAPVIVQDKEITKVNPTSWEQYVSDYAVSKQKTFLTGLMGQITNNIVNVTVNEKEYKLALAPEEMIALNYYYNTFEMSNEEMLETYGLYNLDSQDNGDLINNVHNGLDKIRLTLVKAKSADEVLKPKFTDEKTQELFTKYVGLKVKYNNATTKSTVKKEVEEALRADFIENGSIDLNEHPSASVILQLIPSAFNLENSPLNAKLNTILVGQETNIDVDGVKDTVEQNGLVDESCSVIDRRLEKFDEDRQTIMNDHRIDMRLNKELLSRVNLDPNDEMDQAYYDSAYMESEFSKYTKNTFDVKTVMIPLMNDYLEKNYQLSDFDNFEELNDEIMKAMIAELQKQQLNNNKPFHPVNNPSGGKKGDVYKGETVKNVPVSENQLTEQQKTEAKNNYLEKNPDITDGTDKEAVKKKEDDIKEDYTALCKEAYEVGQKETIEKGENAPINSKYADHKEAVVRNAYAEGRANGIKIWKEVHNTPKEEKIPDDDKKHEDNPNQGGDKKDKDTPIEEEIIGEGEAEPAPIPPQPEPEPPVEENKHGDNPKQGEDKKDEDTPIEEEIIGEGEAEPAPIPPQPEPPVEENKHGDNLKQGEDKKDEDTPIEEEIDTTDVIDGTITTDSTGVEDMSKYGEVQETSAYTISTDEMAAYIDSLVEEMANPENPINAVEEASVELVR